MTTDLIVCAGITHREHLLDSYEEQLASAGIPFHLEPVPPMPHGPNSMTMRRKIDFVRQMAGKFLHTNRIVISDAFDVQFIGPAPTLPPYVLISAEANCYPEPHLMERFPSPSPWRYVNAGLMSGSPELLLEWCNRVERTEQDLNILDQQWLNRAVAFQWMDIALDTSTAHFYTVSRGERGSIQMKDGQPFNTITSTFPSFFHFSGRCPAAPFHAMLRGDTSEL